MDSKTYTEILKRGYKTIDDIFKDNGESNYNLYKALAEAVEEKLGQYSLARKFLFVDRLKNKKPMYSNAAKNSVIYTNVFQRYDEETGKTISGEQEAKYWTNKMGDYAEAPTSMINSDIIKGIAGVKSFWNEVLKAYEVMADKEGKIFIGMLGHIRDNFKKNGAECEDILSMIKEIKIRMNTGDKELDIILMNINSFTELLNHLDEGKKYFKIVFSILLL